MSRKAFFIMTLLAVIAASLAWWLSARERPGDSGLAGNLLYPGLEQEINQVSKIQLIGAGNVTLATLNKNDDAWTVQEQKGYRADWVQVRTLLAALAKAQVVEQKTKREDYFPRLGVENVASSDAKGILVRLDDRDDLSLIIGHIAVDGSGGRYVRIANQDQALLINERLDISRTANAWSDNLVLEFEPDRLQEMYVRQADGEVIHAGRSGDEKNEFVLKNTPEGREVSSPWAVNSYPSTLSNITAEDVRKADAALPENALNVLFIADNGLNLQLDLYEQGEEHWLRLSANVEPTSAIAAASLQQSQTDSDADAEEIAPIDPASEAEEINRRTAGWEFRIAEFKYNSWAKRMDDLLRPAASIAPNLPAADSGDQG